MDGELDYGHIIRGAITFDQAHSPKPINFFFLYMVICNKY